MRKNIALLSDNGEMLLEEINELDIPQDDLGASLEQLEQMEDALDDAGATAETVETLTTVLQNTEEVNPVALESLMRAHTHLVNRIGFSTESYRYTNKAVALESFMDSAKNIYESIIKVFKKAVDWVVGFFKQLFDRVERLKNTAKKLKQIASENADKKLSNDSIEQQGFSKLLCYNGQLIDGQQLYPGLNALFKVMGDLESKHLTKETIAKATKHVEDFMNRSDAASKEVSGGALNDLLSDMPKFKASPKQEGMQRGYVRGEEVLPFGNKSMFSVMPAQFAATETLNAGFNIQLGDSSRQKQVSEADKHEPFKDVRDIESVADSIVKYLEHFSDSDKVIKELEKTLKGITKFTKIKTDGDGKRDMSKIQIFGMLTVIRKAYVAFYSSIKNYSVSVCQAALQFCQVNLKTMS